MTCAVPGTHLGHLPGSLQEDRAAHERLVSELQDPSPEDSVDTTYSLTLDFTEGGTRAIDGADFPTAGPRAGPGTRDELCIRRSHAAPACTPAAAREALTSGSPGGSYL